MAKSNVGQWDVTAANNTDVGGINIAEGCPPSNVNDAMREMMAQLKTEHVATQSASNLTSGTLDNDRLDVGVLPTTVNVDDTTDWDTLTDVGHQPKVYNGGNAHGPGGVDYYHVENYLYPGGQITQVARSYAYPGNAILMRGKYAGSWSAWVRFARADEIPSARSIPKAWALVSAAGNVAAGYNVSSVTKNATGRWTASLSVTMDSENYAVETGCVDANGRFVITNNYSTSGFRIDVTNNSDVYTDPFYFSFAVFGDLA